MLDAGIVGGGPPELQVYARSAHRVAGVADVPGALDPRVRNGASRIALIVHLGSQAHAEHGGLTCFIGNRHRRVALVAHRIEHFEVGADAGLQPARARHVHKVGRRAVGKARHRQVVVHQDDLPEAFVEGNGSSDNVLINLQVVGGCRAELDVRAGGRAAVALPVAAYRPEPAERALPQRFIACRGQGAGYDNLVGNLLSAAFPD